LRRIPVSLGPHSYEIVIGHEILARLGEALSELKLGSRQMIVTSGPVWNLYGKIVRHSLEASGFDVSVMLVSDNEEAKSFQTLATILDRLLESEFERSSVIIALGGGVVGDVSGFAAAIFMRGLRHVQVPTTLLAQVDSSIGGKTGVNHPKAKNLVGAFHQPSLVWVDTSTLSTLPERQMRSGLAEIIKYSVIADPVLFKLLTESVDSFSTISRDALIEIVSRCCSIKARIVEEDEREHGVRSILNYGHSIGHALETLTGYAHYTHGEAVAIGMMAAARISFEIGATDQDMVQSQEDLIKRAELPTAISQPIDSIEIVRQLRKDKKRADDRMRWVLPRRLGEVFLTEDVPSDIVLKVLHDISTYPEIRAGCI
jgi:3-dehydroquinate synthase